VIQPERKTPTPALSDLQDALWLAGIALGSSLWCLFAARELGATFDEPIYLRLGLERWHSGAVNPLMRLGAMPLAIDFCMLPLYLFECSTGRLIEWSRDFHWALSWARTVTLGFWWLLLWAVFQIGRDLGGSWAGRIAAALVASEPSMLAHASLATSDIPVTAMLAALALQHERVGLRRPWQIGALYGFALLTKASALVFGPLCLIVMEAVRQWRAGTLWKFAEWKSFARNLLLVLGIGFVVALLYCGSDWKTERTFVEWAEALPSGPTREAMRLISEHLRIFSNAGEGIVQQIKHNIRGHNTFILGREYSRAVWFYFPVALSIKSSLTLLALPLLLGFARIRSLLQWPNLVAIALLIYSLACRVQIGTRLLLPMVAFLCAGLGPSIVTAAQKHRWIATLAAIGILANVFTLAAEWPDAISFINPVWGGKARGHLLLSDSNFDWGQGLPELRAWQKTRGSQTLDVWYFGTDPGAHHPPFRELPLHRLSGDPAGFTRGKLVAVSVTLLHGTYTHDEPAQSAASFFRTQNPVARTSTFFIYDFLEDSGDNRD
jgi:hypothetical protein